MFFGGHGVCWGIATGGDGFPSCGEVR